MMTGVGMFIFEEFVLEDRQIEHSARDVRVRQVEDRAEEGKLLAAPDRNPVGHPFDFDDREIGHVDYGPVHEGAVSSAPGYQFGYLSHG